MQLFKTMGDVEKFLASLETDLDRIDCIDYLILELSELLKDLSKQGSGNPTKVPTASPDTIKKWRSLLPALRKHRSQFMKIHKKEFQERFLNSIPKKRRLIFPVSTNKKELSENIRFVSRENKSKLHEYLVWNINILEKDKSSRGWVLREEERWRMALDENKNKKDWRAMLWKVMNITKGFVKELKKEEKRVYRNMVTKSLQPQNNPTNHNPKTIPSFRKQIPWLGSKKQLQTLLELLYQNQLISSSNINVMISTHFWDAKNQKRFGNLKSYGRQNNLIPWIGSQGQLKKLFQLLIKPKKSVS